MTFIKKVEDFICDNCGEPVSGNGYTNHCPKCLWSKHVDIEPGDRISDCGGMMRPDSLEAVNGGFVITHKCEKCGAEKRNKVSSGDDMDMAARIC